MIYYYLLFLAIYLCSYNDICCRDSLSIKKSFNILFVISVCLFFVVFTGLKGNVGTDYDGYVELYSVWGAKKYSDPFVKIQIEPLFWGICYIFNQLHTPFPVVWFFLACITLFTKFVFIRKLSPYMYLSLLIYLSGLFIERDFDGIRQGLSVGFAYMAILQYIKHKRIKYILLLIISIGIHYSSVVFLLIPLLYKIKIKKQLMYILLFIGFIFVALDIDFVSLAIKFLPNGYLLTRVNSYLKQGVYSHSAGINIGIIVRIIVLLLFCNFDRMRMSIPEDVHNFLCNGFLLSILCFLFFNKMEILAHRLVYGFREFQIIIIPLCFKYYVMDKRYAGSTKFLFFQIYSFYAFILFHRMINTPHLKKYYDYHFILEELI